MNLSNLLKYFNKYKFSIKKSIYINTDVLNSSVIRQKGESQNGCFKKTKQCQIFQKTNISHPLTRTHTSAYQGVRNVRFSEIWLAFFSWNTRFEIRPFVLLPTNYSRKERSWSIANQNLTRNDTEFLRTPIVSKK